MKTLNSKPWKLQQEASLLSFLRSHGSGDILNEAIVIHVHLSFEEKWDFKN